MTNRKLITVVIY